jgi:iron complex outermembrane recepter protein
MKKTLALLLLGLSFSALAQTYTISGKVYNRSDVSDILIGVHIVYGPGQGVVTDIDGNYKIELPSGKYSITYSYVGFEPVTKEVEITSRNQIVDVGLAPLTIGEVVIVADVARSRETPVAFSNITPAMIQENLAAQDIPMLLNSTPGVYATQEGGGDGDAQVTIRGFSSRNVGVLLDGVPVNDMENGHVYWSNWFGLDAVTRSIQVQRGLGASKLALPSVGGTINIITRGLDSRKGGSFKQEVGSDGYLRSSFGYNTGELKNGWGISVAGSYKRGDGYVDQTWTKGYFYYLKIDKKIGNHIISLSGYGAPQSHGQRSFKLPIAVYDSAYAEKLGIRLGYDSDMSVEDSIKVSQNRSKADEGIDMGIRFNQHWGYLARTLEDPDAEPEPLTERVNKYHKPQFTLKDFWTINENLYLSNIAYLSIGRGGGIREKSTMVPNSEGLKPFQSVYDRNIGPGTVSTIYDDQLHAATNHLRMLVNEHFWTGLLSTINYRPNSIINYSGGIDLRYYKGTHFEKVYDLLGADYVAPAYADYSQIDWTASNPLSSLMLFEGDKNNFYYDGLVRWGGLFFQSEYKYNRISSFINVTGSLTSYKEINYFYGINPAIKNRENGFHTFPGATLKGGMNYNFTERMNAFLNLGYLSKAPRMNNVFDYDNALYRDIQNELVKAIELGYSYSSGRFSANLNSYYTIWENKPVDQASRVTVEVQPGEFEEQSVNINGMDALHKGIELDFIFKFNNKLEIQGLASLGDWRWNSEDTAQIVDDFNNVVAEIYFNAIGVHVGNSAQTQFAGELRWEPFKDFYIKPRYTYFDRYFAQFDPISLNVEPIDSWKVPGYGLLDIHAGYRISMDQGRNIQFRFNVLNALNATYIATAQNNDGFNGIALRGFDARSSAVFMGLGRRYNLSIQYLF